MANLHVLSHYGAVQAMPAVRRIRTADLKRALAEGLEDFWAMPTHVLFIGAIYPIVGLILGRVAMGYDALPLVFPLISGFALLGPVAGVGLYELSRRRELGMDTRWRHALEVVHAPGFPGILALGALLTLMFLAWIGISQGLYEWLFGPRGPVSVSAFLHDIVSTREGWTLAILGNLIGFTFAATAFAISVVSFPLMLDRGVGPAVAISTSLRACAANPGVMAVWAAFVAAMLVIGFVPLFFGLAVVIPVLAHASWRLYRRVVV
ncbi:hypothetical protein SLNSH_17445 [Alsobacter soli]|uniref:DUF2189 domain-containing protein n=1 Tax=Alsobacter soli TaxID=2109933 RepID=A0A2T1HQC6_9HYPH|nr:DUF2189 domain-containing protein [Alsobacter soli]PSC03729.1 hypothetical protein SLNSH_17445 [Alsobacter soli]